MVRLFFPNTREDYLALVDTGCMFPMIAERWLVADANLNSTGRIRPATVASGKSQDFLEYEAHVRWMGSDTGTFVYVPLLKDDPAAGLKRPKDGEPELMIGLGLIDLCILEINFKADKLLITR